MSRPGIAASAALCGAVGAGFYLTVLIGSPGSLILITMAQLPLFTAGLWLGVGAAALAALAATVILLAATGAISAAFFAAVMAGPVVVLVRQALSIRTRGDGAVDWSPAGPLATWLTGLALVGMALGMLLVGGTHGIEAVVRRSLGPALDRLMVESVPDREEIIRSVALILPGTLAASWMAMVATNGILAQGVLARFGANQRPSPDIAALRLAIWMPILFAVGALVAPLGGTMRLVGVNVMIVLVVPFCLAGLALVHTAARRLSHPFPVLVICYVLAALFGWPLLLIAVLGLCDAALGLRRHVPGRKSFGGRSDG
jgi:hypothetical protein